MCDLNRMLFKIPAKKLDRILSDIDKVLEFRWRAYVRNVAGLVGKVMACTREIGQVMGIMLHSFYRWINDTQWAFS